MPKNQRKAKVEGTFILSLSSSLYRLTPAIHLVNVDIVTESEHINQKKDGSLSLLVLGEEVLFT